MEKILVRITVELETSAHRDPRDLAQDVSDAVDRLVMGSIKDVRYAVASGTPISETGLSVPRRGSI